LRDVGSPVIKSTPLLVDGVLYFTVPDHLYAVDARTEGNCGVTTGRITAAIFCWML
jgi:glucose dehydrogenase